MAMNNELAPVRQDLMVPLKTRVIGFQRIGGRPRLELLSGNKRTLYTGIPTSAIDTSKPVEGDSGRIPHTLPVAERTAAPTSSSSLNLDQ